MEFAAGVLGVLLITSEYATGLIRTTLAAVPRRLPTLWGKAAVVTGAVVAVSVPAAVAVFLAGQAILGRQHLSVSFGEPGVARAVIGGALYLAVAALLDDDGQDLLRQLAGNQRLRARQQPVCQHLERQHLDVHAQPVERGERTRPCVLGDGLVEGELGLLLGAAEFVVGAGGLEGGAEPDREADGHSLGRGEATAWGRCPDRSPTCASTTDLRIYN